MGVGVGACESVSCVSVRVWKGSMEHMIYGAFKSHALLLGLRDICELINCLKRGADGWHGRDGAEGGLCRGTT